MSTQFMFLIVMLKIYFLRRILRGKVFNTDVNAYFLSLLRVSERRADSRIKIRALVYGDGRSNVT